MGILRTLLATYRVYSRYIMELNYAQCFFASEISIYD